MEVAGSGGRKLSDNGHRRSMWKLASGGWLVEVIGDDDWR